MEAAWANESSSSSSISTQFKYDVFLSFSGDTRNNYTSHLLDALERHGFHTFRDDTKLKQGEYISDALLKAIEESRISLVILSKNYVASSWCLDELVKIMECKKTLQQIVIPIFYNVEPTDVRVQKGSLAEAFAKHEERLKDSSDRKVKQWRDALTEVANLSGWDLPMVANGDEAHLIRKVIEEVQNKLDPLHLHVACHEIGLESRLKKFQKLLKMESDDVHIIAVRGMGGIGKTTIVKKLYNLIQHKFEGSCFLTNIRETSKQPNGLVVLQEQLLFGILGPGTRNLRNFHQGIEVIKRRALSRKVLLILDDVDDVQQLKALAIDRDSFGFGSRIILTTRDISSLNLLKVDEIYAAEKFNEDESLELFSWHCFKDDHPTEDHLDLSRQVVHYAGGLPLALEILGSSFRGKSIPEWKSAIAKLKKIPADEIQEKRKTSFDSLSMEAAWENEASSSSSISTQFKEISTVSTATEGASQSEHQVLPTPLESQQPCTKKISTTATEGAPQSQHQVLPTPLESQQPSTVKIFRVAIEDAPQSQQQVPLTPLDSTHPSTVKMSSTATEGAPQMKDILLGKIKDYVVSPIGRQFTYMFDFNNNIEKLETELEELQRIRDLLQREVDEGRAQVRIIERNVEAWLTRAIEVTNQVEGIITDKAKVKEGCLNGFWANIKLRYSVSKKAVKNTKVVVDLEAAGFDYVKSAYRMPQVENFRALKSRRLNMEEISEKNFNALNSQRLNMEEISEEKALSPQMLNMEEIIKALKLDQIDLIGICGMGGVGKTTMATNVAKRAKENKLFDEVAMAVVGQNPNLSKVQASIAGMLGLKFGDLENPMVRATLLCQRLLQDNKKILIILDDIWEEFDLRAIGIPLGGGNKNIKILYTSRVRDLWGDLQTKKEIPLELLSDDEAWQLFREKVGDLADDPDLQPIAKQIVNECGRLPLALVLIGSTLSKKGRGIFIKDMWEEMLNMLICSRSTTAEKRLSSSLELSYKYIEDVEARRLFLLCLFGLLLV